MAAENDPIEGTSSGRRAVTRGVVLTLTGATAVTGGGLLSLGTALTAAAQEIDPGSVIVSDQDVDVTNFGLAGANSGLNAAIGNGSENGAIVEQIAGGHHLPPVYEAALLSESNGGGGGIVNLTGAASNGSDGSATISTGAASAVGNTGSTTISQTAPAPAPAPGVTVIEQDADVENIGIAGSNSGLNLAIGNASSNGAAVSQVTGHGAITNATGSATNGSNGSASITTGAASATGNSTTVSITQG